MTTQMDRAQCSPARPDPITDTAVPRRERPLAVLIVTYKSRDLIEQCLASVAQHLPELPIYVYENSGDAYPGREELVTRHPEVHWVLGPVNLGFAAAFNALIKHAPADTDILLMNDDARLRGPLTRTRQMLQQPGVAAVSPTICDSSITPAPWDVARRRTKLFRALVAATGYSDVLRGTPMSQLYGRQPAESEEIDGYIAGTCLAISRAAWKSIGEFDEEFFLYGEDLNWQTRAQAGGWRVLMADELGADHGNPKADEHADGPAAMHGALVSTEERRRNKDMLRANTALVIEHQSTVHHADVYLAATTALDRVQRSKRLARRRDRANRRTDLPAIVITTNRLVYGGAERQKSILASELARRGYPVTLACVQRFGPLIREIPHRVRVVRQPWWAPSVDLPDGPAVVISGDTNTETGFATLWRAAGAGRQGGRRWLVAPHTHPDMPIYSRPLVAAMNRSDGFIMLAQRHWDMLAEHHRLTRRHFVAPNGVVIEEQPRATTRSTGDPVHLVMLSRIVEFKNPHVLINALADLPDLPWKLSIFGDGPDREQLEARTPQAVRDRVHWRGWSDGPGPALADADLLCMPSRCETFPLVVLEAMARGIPVASSAVCAVPEILDYGKAGFLVEDVSVAGWRERLAEILADPAALPSVGKTGFQRASTHYTVEAMADAYVDAINAVL